MKETNDLLEKIHYWSSKYEFFFHFLEHGLNSVDLEKGGVNLYSSGGFEKPKDAIENAIQYINKINNIKK